MRVLFRSTEEHQHGFHVDVDAGLRRIGFDEFAEQLAIQLPERIVRRLWRTQHMEQPRAAELRIGHRELGHVFDDATTRVGQLCLLFRAQSALGRSEEHTSELQSLMRISYAVFCLKKKKLSY